MKRLILFFFLCLFCLLSCGQDTKIVSRLNFYFNLIEIKKDSSYYDYINNKLPYIESNIDKVQKIILTGYSSPEGNENHNRKLADGRIQSVINLSSIPSNYYVRQSIGDDYDDMYNEVIKIDSLAAKNMILNKDPKKFITSYNNGKIWKQMHKSFNMMRYVSIEVIFKGIVNIVHSKYITDTVYIKEHDTLYIERNKIRKTKPFIAIKSNILADAFPYSPFGISFTPNIQAELYTWIWGTSIEFEYIFPWWSSTNKCYQIMNGTLGIRKYFNNKYIGFYIGIYVNNGIYDLMKDEDNGWQGEVKGTGISFGYIFPTKYKRLKFEPYIRIGYLSGRFDKYHYGNDRTNRYYYTYDGRNSEFAERRFKMNYFGPTMIGINITYDLVCVKH